jgi:hypothetical protein
VRIWEERSDGSSRLRSRLRDRSRSLAFGMTIRWRPYLPALLGRDYLFVRIQAGEDLGADCVIVGDHLQSEWRSDGSSRLRHQMH